MTTAVALDADSWHAGYDQGVADGRATLEHELAARTTDVLVPVPTPWSLVRVGDVMRAANGALWIVVSCVRSPDGLVRPRLLGPGAQTYPRHGDQPVAVHPDERVPILTPMPEHIALSALRGAFGEQHIRRLQEVPT